MIQSDLDYSIDQSNGPNLITRSTIIWTIAENPLSKNCASDKTNFTLSLSFIFMIE